MAAEALHPSQASSHSFRQELGRLLQLGLPIALVQLGMTALNFVDIAMLGHHSAASLPAMALGNTLAWGATMFCMGTVTAIEPCCRCPRRCCCYLPPPGCGGAASPRR
jgi:Na+-driven multidrug efflux pump